MSKKLSVILLEDIDSLGVSGDIISVSEGYARNALFPAGKAALATDTARLARAEHLKAQAAATVAATQAAQELAQTLEGTELTLPARIKDGDEIFGRITKKHIAAALTKQAKLKVTAKQIDLPEALTKLGSQDVTINLTDDVAATIRVTIEADAKQA